MKSVWIGKHIPFSWTLSEEQYEEFLDRDFFLSGNFEPLADWKYLPAFSDFNTALAAIMKVADSADEHPESTRLLQALSHQIVIALRYSSAEESERMLVALAKYIIEAIDLCPLEKLQPIARMEGQWPSLVKLKDTRPRRKGSRETSLLCDKLKQLQLGADLPIKELGSGESNRFAYLMVRTIRDNHAMLQRRKSANVSGGDNSSTASNGRSIPPWVRKCALPFDKRSPEEWFEVGWEALMEATKQQPERVRKLRSLGKFRADKYLQADDSNRKTQKSRESNIRSGIKEKLHAAFLRLVKKRTKTKRRSRKKSK